MSYQTVMIKNNSNFPATFKISIEDFQGVPYGSGELDKRSQVKLNEID